MDARRWVLVGVAIAVVLAAALLAVLPRAPRRPAAGDPVAAPAPPRMTPADLYATFIDPAPARSSDMAVTLSVEDAGVLFLPNDALVATDAFIIDASPFTLDVPAGHHPVSVLRSDFEDGDRRIAAAMIRFGPDEPVRWDLAVVPGQDQSVLGRDEIFGYGVDSGTGAFTSPEAVGQLKDEARYSAFSRALLAAMPGKTLADAMTASVMVDDTMGTNVVAFASGFGDGSYPSYAGFGGDGQVVVVLTDFGILDAPKD